MCVWAGGVGRLGAVQHVLNEGEDILLLCTRIWVYFLPQGGPGVKGGLPSWVYPVKVLQPFLVSRVSNTF